MEENSEEDEKTERQTDLQIVRQTKEPSKTEQNSAREKTYWFQKESPMKKSQENQFLAATTVRETKLRPLSKSAKNTDSIEIKKIKLDKSNKRSPIEN